MVFAIQEWGFKFDSRTQMKLLGRVVCPCNPNSEKARAGGVLGLLANQPSQITSSRSMTGQFQKKKKKRDYFLVKTLETDT